MTRPGYSPEEENPEVERLLVQANLLRARGQLEEALGLLRAAAEQQPDAWAVWELIGDLEHERTQFETALEAYRRAHELNPERATLEEKVGMVALEQEEWERRLARARYLDDHPEERSRLEREMRNPLVAGLLSILLPGVGQIYNRQKEKGLILLVLDVLLLCLLAVVGLGVLQMGDRFMDALRSQPVSTLFSLLLCLVLLAALLVFSVLDAVLQAVKINQRLEEGEAPE